MMKFPIAMLPLMLMVGSCSQTRTVPHTLNQSELMQCGSQGGYESRAPFGSPICQIPYADAGKTCSGKSDCVGKCLFDAGDDWRKWATGMPAVGRCEAEKQTFGCYAVVEGGKLATDGMCVD